MGPETEVHILDNGLPPSDLQKRLVLSAQTLISQEKLGIYIGTPRRESCVQAPT